MLRRTSKYPRIIAVDFDGCLVQDEWPLTGQPLLHNIEAVREEQRRGSKLILWTCREGDLLWEAVEFCTTIGIVFDAINDNLPENKEFFPNNSRKIFATEYWDDRAVRKDVQTRTLKKPKKTSYNRFLRDPLYRLKIWISNLRF